jgi:hypothetical protein
VTHSNTENIVIHYCGGAAEGEARTEAQTLVGRLEELAPEHSFRAEDKAVESSAPGMVTWELLEQIGLNYEKSSWYVAHSTPEGSNVAPPGT